MMKSSELMDCMGQAMSCISATSQSVAPMVRDTCKALSSSRTPAGSAAYEDCSGSQRMEEDVELVSERIVYPNLSLLIPSTPGRELSLQEYQELVNETVYDGELMFDDSSKENVPPETLIAKATGDYLHVTVEQEAAVDSILSLCEELSTKPATTATRKRRVTPTLVLDFESLAKHPKGEELARGADLISLLLRTASDLELEEEDFLKSMRLHFYGTQEALVPLALFMSPIEPMLPKCIGTTDPLAKERAELRARKQEAKRTGKTQPITGGTDTNSMNM